MQRILLAAAGLALACAFVPAGAQPASAEALYVYDASYLFCIDTSGPDLGRWWIRDYAHTFFYGSGLMDTLRVDAPKVRFATRRAVWEAFTDTNPAISLAGRAVLGGGGVLKLKDPAARRIVAIREGQTLRDPGRCWSE